MFPFNYWTWLLGSDSSGFSNFAGMSIMFGMAFAVVGGIICAITCDDYTTKQNFRRFFGVLFLTPVMVWAWPPILAIALIMVVVWLISPGVENTILDPWKSLGAPVREARRIKAERIQAEGSLRLAQQRDRLREQAQMRREINALERQMDIPESRWVD